MNGDWFYIHDIDKIDSPALVIYADRVKKNISLIISMIDDPLRLRPHVKTHKTKEATLLQMEAGIRKFKCATIAEAEMLGSVGAPDVLLAYQPVGPKIERFISLIKHYASTKFSCLVDNLDAARIIAAAASKSNLIIPVYIDLNIGMNRTGIAPDEKAIALYEQCKEMRGIVPVGLHAYDGHIHDTSLSAREGKTKEAFAPLERIRDEIRKKGMSEPIVIAGGSPTFPIHAKNKNVECSPGTFVYWDAGYLDFEEQPFLPAALVISRVISLPTSTTICTDLGHKSIAAEKTLTNRVRFLNAPELTCIGQSEEHLVLEAPKNHKYKVGDVLYGLPFHVCPTCALYERAITIENGNVHGEWKMVARDRAITI